MQRPAPSRPTESDIVQKLAKYFTIIETANDLPAFERYYHYFSQLSSTYRAAAAEQLCTALTSPKTPHTAIKPLIYFLDFIVRQALLSTNTATLRDAFEPHIASVMQLLYTRIIDDLVVTDLHVYMWNASLSRFFTNQQAPAYSRAIQCCQHLTQQHTFLTMVKTSVDKVYERWYQTSDSEQPAFSYDALDRMYEIITSLNEQYHDRIEQQKPIAQQILLTYQQQQQLQQQQQHPQQLQRFSGQFQPQGQFNQQGGVSHPQQQQQQQQFAPPNGMLQPPQFNPQQIQQGFSQPQQQHPPGQYNNFTNYGNPNMMYSNQTSNDNNNDEEMTIFNDDDNGEYYSNNNNNNNNNDIKNNTTTSIAQLYDDATIPQYTTSVLRRQQYALYSTFLQLTPFSCEICGAMFASEETFHEHQERHRIEDELAQTVVRTRVGVAMRQHRQWNYSPAQWIFHHQVIPLNILTQDQKNKNNDANNDPLNNLDNDNNNNNDSNNDGNGDGDDDQRFYYIKGEKYPIPSMIVEDSSSVKTCMICQNVVKPHFSSDDDQWVYLNCCLFSYEKIINLHNQLHGDDPAKNTPFVMQGYIKYTDPSFIGKLVHFKPCLTNIVKDNVSIVETTTKKAPQNATINSIFASHHM